MDNQESNKKKPFLNKHPKLERFIIVALLDLIIFAIGFVVWWMFKDTSHISFATWTTVAIAMIALTVLFWKTSE